MLLNFIFAMLAIFTACMAVIGVMITIVAIKAVFSKKKEDKEHIDEPVEKG